MQWWEAEELIEEDLEEQIELEEEKLIEEEIID